MMSPEEPALQFWLLEYEKLKDEQTQRIGFRDNLLYVTLGLFGVILPFALSSPTYYPALLVIPWFCLILGWTYLVNDEKISAIGSYIRLTLAENIQQQSGSPYLKFLFAWETLHRSDIRRSRRKIEQLIIDQITFVLSGIISLVSFFFLVPQPARPIYILGGFELLILLILSVEVFIYADLGKGK